ncbi:ribonuclease H-like protein [Imleria badia]|nr:ribonuclease H-like protein [Imleria badia]
MRTIVTDDDGSEWSIEILDGVNAPTAQPVKQTRPTTSKEIHPFFLNEVSTMATVSGTRLTSQEVAKHALDARRTPCIFPRELTERSHPTSVTNYAKKTNPTIHAHKPLDMSPPDGHHGGIQFQKNPQYARSHQPIQLTRDTSSGSSTQNSSAGKANEGELSLPIYSFMEYKRVPAVVYTKSESEANSLVQTLQGPLGFDLEWRVMWHPGAQERRTALVQLCDHDTILLIQVSSMKRFPRKALEVIESADVVKTGANILNDGEKLFRDFGIRARGLVELGAFATKADDTFSTIYNREIVSLAKMVAMYLGKTLLKGKVRTSNWEADLSPKMVEYAANDCHCALMVCDRLQEIASQTGKTLDASTCSRHVDPRSLKLKDASLLKLPRSLDAPTKPLVPDYCIPEPPRPQQLRAYKLWRVDKMPLEQMCMTLRTGARVEPLKESTVISYVVGALQADPRLPFDMAELKALVLMEASSWQRHRQWIASRE